jgi:hypothetical protein
METPPPPDAPFDTPAVAHKPVAQPEMQRAEKAQQEPEQVKYSAAVILSLEEVEAKWADVIARVKRTRVALGALLTEGWPTRVEGNTIELGFDSKNGFHITSVERQIAAVEEVVQDIFGARFKIVCIRIEKEKLAEVRKVPVRVDKKTEFQKLEQEDDIVKQIVDKFDAEFIK